MYGWLNIPITASIGEYFVYLTSKLPLSLFIYFPKVRNIIIIIIIIIITTTTTSLPRYEFTHVQ